MLRGVSFGLAMACESAAVAALMVPAAILWQMAVFSILHLVASYVFSRLFSAGPAPENGTGRLVFVFSLFVPVFGGLGAAAYLNGFCQAQKRGERFCFQRIPLLRLSGRGLRPAAFMGEGGAWARLRAEVLPQSRRMEALMAVDEFSGRYASRLYQRAAGDRDEEVRLLAFHLLDGLEKAVSLPINETLTRMKYARGDREQAELCRLLAYSYWELVYKELAGKELLGFYLDEGLRYAAQAEELAGETLSLSLLRARICLRREDFAGAEQAIGRALELRAPPDKAIPYQAELFYRQRKFGALRQLLASRPGLCRKPGIGEVFSVWCGGDDGQFS